MQAIVSDVQGHRLVTKAVGTCQGGEGSRRRRHGHGWEVRLPYGESHELPGNHVGHHGRIIGIRKDGDRCLR